MSTNPIDMSREPRIITEAKDVTDDIVAQVLDVVDGWYSDPDEPIDWEDVWNRVEKYNDAFHFGDQIDTPAMRKIQRRVRAARREM